MFYSSLSISKQSVHQMLDRRMQYNEEVGFLSKIVYEIRQDHPTLSLRDHLFQDPTIRYRQR